MQITLGTHKPTTNQPTEIHHKRLQITLGTHKPTQQPTNRNPTQKTADHSRHTKTNQPTEIQHKRLQMTLGTHKQTQQPTNRNPAQKTADDPRHTQTNQPTEIHHKRLQITLGTHRPTYKLARIHHKRLQITLGSYKPKHKQLARIQNKRLEITLGTCELTHQPANQHKRLMITLPVRRGVHASAFVTCVEQLVHLGVPHEEDVVHGHAAYQVQHEPALHVVLGDLLGVQDDLVGEVVDYDACG